MFGARLIQAGKSSIVLAGGSDSISKFVLNGFLS
jgi:3-oxoacyl-(acyl-carrier-protein) synthase